MVINTFKPILYAIADRHFFKNDMLWLEKTKILSESLPKKYCALQIRSKENNPYIRLKQLEKARTITLKSSQKGLPIFVNGSLEDAQKLGFEHVHFPENSIPSSNFTRSYSMKISASIHSLSAFKKAIQIKADFLVYGPIYSPGSKNTKGVGTKTLENIIKKSPIPIFAIGGITPERIKHIHKVHCYRVAVVSFLLGSQVMSTSIQKLLDKLIIEDYTK